MAFGYLKWFEFKFPAFFLCRLTVWHFVAFAVGASPTSVKVARARARRVQLAPATCSGQQARPQQRQFLRVRGIVEVGQITAAGRLLRGASELSAATHHSQPGPAGTRQVQTHAGIVPSRQAMNRRKLWPEICKIKHLNHSQIKIYILPNYKTFLAKSLFMNFLNKYIIG